MSSAPDPDGRQRSSGAGEITVRAGHRSQALSHLYQQGSARIRLPRTDDAALEAVLINTAGGLTGGDTLSWNVQIEDGAAARISTAAAEKLYRTHGPPASVRSRITVGAGARLDWLPQESIAFDRSALDRQLDIQLHASATLLVVESFLLGRQAMAERLQTIHLNDQWRVWRTGTLLHAEALRFSGDIHRSALRSGILHNFSAMSTVLFVSPGSQDYHRHLVERIHTSFPTEYGQAVVAAGTAFSGKLLIRLLAVDGFALRRYLIPCLQSLNDGRPLPRVWEV